ncbi:unnamed protein product, partial [Mesorhabditis spiculigera]
MVSYMVRIQPILLQQPREQALIVDQVPHSSDTKLALHECDLRDLKAVANFAQTFKEKHRQIDLFIGNAGVLHPRDSWTDHAAVDGMNVNVVAHAALIEILRPVLARDHRVLLMGSCCSHACLATNRIKTDSSFLYDAHGPYQAYAFSKLLLAVYGEMHAQSMHITHPGATLCVVHPGVVPSALYRKTNPLTRLAIGYMLPLIARSAEDAAILSLHTAFREDVKSGLYFEDGQPTSVGRDLEKATKMAIMVNVKKGVMITCDPAMQKLLVHLDETRALGSQFIVKELDETHLIVDKDIVPTIEAKIDELMEQMNPEATEK